MTTHCCWPECSGQGLRPDLPLCDGHFAHVGTRYIDERTLAGPTYRAVLERTDKERREKLLADEIRRGQLATEHRERVAARSVVYYVRTGRYIKIGFTADLRSRLHSLRLDRAAVLVTEPGGRTVEAQRHQQFATDRVGRREDFVPSAALMEHIQELQEQQRES